MTDKLTIAREALEFYAREDVYKITPIIVNELEDGYDSEVLEDGGQCARAALAQLSADPPAIDFTPPKRHVDTVFLHCSASSNDAHDDISVIRQWHLDRGWQDVGYHYFIRRDGTIQAGRDLELIPAAQAPHNTGSIAICLHGGGGDPPADDFKASQLNACMHLCNAIDRSYGHPAGQHGTIRFRGHCEVANKACPVFDYRKLLGLDQRGFMN